MLILRSLRPAALALCLGLLVAIHPAAADDAISAGAITVHPSTLHSIGLSWAISGDDNRNAKVEISCRKPGDKQWRNGLPMLRIGGETTGSELYETEYDVPHAFVGSIFDLEPGVTYEVRLVLKDPDGGNVNRMSEAATRQLPVMPEDARPLHVYPEGFRGHPEEPHFDSIQAAYAEAKPGDEILIHAGIYQVSLVLAKQGTPERPIMIRGADDGEVVIEGIGQRQVLDVHHSAYNWFENITFRDPKTGDGLHTRDGVVFHCGDRKRRLTPGCQGLIVRHCKFENFGTAILARDATCRDFIITDNYFNGRQDWLAPLENKEFDYTQHSGAAVLIAGSGHDLAFNYIQNVRDGIRVANGRSRRGQDPEDLNVSIDIYNNEITLVGEEFIDIDEADFNIRVLRNRCINSQNAGITVRPVYGGGIYILRNTVYSVARPWPLRFAAAPTGLLVYHNTFVSSWHDMKGWSNGHFRNNVFLGDLQTATFTDYSSFDYNGFMPGQVVFMSPQLGWQDEAERVLTVKAFPDRAAFTEATGYEQNGVDVDWKIFKKMPKPKPKRRSRRDGVLNFALRADATAIDAGARLPNVNDDFTGKAPDLGAFESEQEPPFFGPRPRADLDAAANTP